jgi:serine protease Do
MSGGPAVSSEGLVVGVNVATRRGGQLVSFLVPAKFADALLRRVRAQEGTPNFRADIAQQLGAWRAALYKSFADAGCHSNALGPYRAPDATAAWFNCWAQTNMGAKPKPRARIDTTECTSDTGVFVADDLNTGVIRIDHSLVTAVELNQFQFASALTQQSQPRLLTAGPLRKWYTSERCHDDFVRAGAGLDHPPLRAIWCARAYREFDGLYDVSLVAVTQDDGKEALVSRLSLQAVGYDDAVALGRRFLETVQVIR